MISRKTLPPVHSVIDIATDEISVKTFESEEGIPKSPREVNVTISIAVVAKIKNATTFDTKIGNVYFPKCISPSFFFRRGFSKSWRLSIRRDARYSGATIPSTYATPTPTALNMVGEKELSIMTPKTTGAQHADVIPEKIPKVNVESMSGWPFVVDTPKCGIGSFNPRSDNTATPIMMVPPI